MSMPSSTIRHRPIYTTRQIDPVTIRASKHHNNTASTLFPTVTISWHLSFCAGMALALVFLLCGHLI